MAYAGLPPESFTNNLTNVQLIDNISSSRVNLLKK